MTEDELREEARASVKKIMEIFALDGTIAIIKGCIFIKITSHCHLCDESMKLHDGTYNLLIHRLRGLVRTMDYEVKLDVFGHPKLSLY